ncbi:MAG: type I-B CRISPR-associated protein Cas7/Cst2/DevR, partial [Bacteroidia bacterium]|nr:type I-B CRISPR-associated protein Cas7/Cst2/DevR [Bacteroidia bacterium]
LRHHFFQTLLRAHDGKPPWAPAPVKASGSKGKEVIQFDLEKANILTHAELDLFGYMVTLEDSEKGALRRKAVLGITKAVSLAPYMGDLAFYANHDLTERTQSTSSPATPNPYSKEEHYSYYKVSFVIDVLRLGVDEWWLSDPLNTRGDPEQGDIVTIRTQKRFVLHETKRQERLEAVLNVIKGGLFSQSSGELNSLVPYFLAVAFVKVPSPILDPYIYWPPDRSHSTGGFCMPFEPRVLSNPWYVSKAQGGGIYLEGVYQGRLLEPCSSGWRDELIEKWEELMNRAREAIRETQQLIEGDTQVFKQKAEAIPIEGGEGKKKKKES